MSNVVIMLDGGECNLRGASLTGSADLGRIEPTRYRRRGAESLPAPVLVLVVDGDLTSSGAQLSK